MTGGKRRLLSCYPVLSAGLEGIDARSLDVTLVAARSLSLIEVRRRSSSPV